MKNEYSRVRADDDRPEDEVAKELSKSDLHSDPDEPNSPATIRPFAEAAASWRVANSLLKLREQVDARSPRRSKASDGTIGDAAHCPGSSDHCANIRDGGVGVVTAMDITHDPAHGCNSESLAEAIRKSEDPRVKYIISNRKIAHFTALGGAAPWAWRDYPGANPHDKHVHISVRPQKTAYDSTVDWEIDLD
jgi:hypothetical protein